jgi:predicted nuclease of restriction endonuclease-like RecB superfamily
MQVHIYSGFKDFWKYIKFFKLMFWATPLEKGYCVTLDGPISPFVKATTRYGRQLAAFLPALFLCDRWQMRASVRPPQSDQALVYQLNHTTGLVTHFKRSGEFDSRLEADFAADFQAKFGKNKSDNQRGEWLLTREDEVILLGDTVMIPDFALTNQQDGRRALVELVGYWHPDYLARKVAKVRAANRRDLILLVYEGVNLSKEKLKDTPSEVLYFANKPVIKEVMEAVERVAM